MPTFGDGFNLRPIGYTLLIFLFSINIEVYQRSTRLCKIDFFNHYGNHQFCCYNFKYVVYFLQKGVVKWV